MQNPEYKFPVTGWLELPYYIGVKKRQDLSPKTVGGDVIPVRYWLRNDLTKVYTGDYLDKKEEREKYFEAIKNGEKPDNREYFVPRYVTVAKAEKVKRELGKSSHHVHIERLSTILQFSTRADENGTLPRGFLPEFTFNWLNTLVTAYRRAVLPAMRYRIQPISETNLSQTFYRVDKQNAPRFVFLNFDVNSNAQMLYSFAEEFGVEERFARFYSETDTNRLDAAFTSVYPLYHQRRYGEALLVASAVFDEVLRKLIYAAASSEDIADLLWKANRTRTDDIFKKVLPALGLPNLAEEKPEVWQKLREARKYRHQAAHMGSFQGAPDLVGGHLETFYIVIQWLIASSRGLLAPWELEMQSKKDGEVLKQFP